MRIQIVASDNYVIDSINLDQYDLEDPDDIQRLVDFLLEIVNEYEDDL